MNATTNIIFYLFPLVDMDDARKIILITESFEKQGRLIKVETLLHDDYSRKRHKDYVEDPTTRYEPYIYLKYLVDHYTATTIKIYIKR